MKKEFTLSHKKILDLDKDLKQAARAARLIYVSVNKPGISRKKKGDGFTYMYNGKLVKDKAELERIKIGYTSFLD